MAERSPVRRSPRGYFGVGIYHTNSEYNTGSLFRTAQAFGANFAFTIGRRYEREKFDTSRFARHTPLYHYEDFDDFRRHLPTGASLVGVELAEGATDLRQFWHPEQAVYLLGAEDYGLPEEILSKCDKIIQLDTPFSLNVSVTGSIVIYDRIQKETQRQARRAAFGGA